MPLLWRDELSVGNVIIDRDHKKLINIINQVEVALAKDDNTVLTQQLDSLFDYSKTHFDHEERIARAVEYMKTGTLHQAHEELLTRLNVFKQQVGDNWTPEAKDVFCSMLRAWLIDHVIKEDMLMKPLLSRYSPGFDA